MTRYQGTLPTALLRDDAIRPTEYTRWADARTRFTRREKDAAILAGLLESIPHQGLNVPLVLGVSDRYGDVYVADGHHRAVALMTLRAPRFPFHWYWIKAAGVRIEDRPFPYYLLPGGPNAQAPTRPHAQARTRVREADLPGQARCTR